MTRCVRCHRLLFFWQRRGFRVQADGSVVRRHWGCGGWTLLSAGWLLGSDKAKAPAPRVEEQRPSRLDELPVSPSPRPIALQELGGSDGDNSRDAERPEDHHA